MRQMQEGEWPVVAAGVGRLMEVGVVAGLKRDQKNLSDHLAKCALDYSG